MAKGTAQTCATHCVRWVRAAPHTHRHHRERTCWQSKTCDGMATRLCQPSIQDSKTQELGGGRGRGASSYQQGGMQQSVEARESLRRPKGSTFQSSKATSARWPGATRYILEGSSMAMDRSKGTGTCTSSEPAPKRKNLLLYAVARRSNTEQAYRVCTRKQKHTVVCKECWLESNGLAHMDSRYTRSMELEGTCGSVQQVLDQSKSRVLGVCREAQGAEAVACLREAFAQIRWYSRAHMT